MNPTQMRSLCKNQVDNLIDRMHYLCERGKYDDAISIHIEISEWVESIVDIDVISLNYLGEYNG